MKFQKVFMKMDFSRISNTKKALTDEEKQKLKQQNSRLVSEFKANQLEIDAKKFWDLFYKRNESRFFKDRHWTTREFSDLLNRENDSENQILFEIGCGVGNFIFPLIEEGSKFFIYACDLSPRAVDIVRKSTLYDATKIKVFQCNITNQSVFEEVEENKVDIATLIFVLSAIHPDKFLITLRNIYKLLKPGGVLLFRDYGLYDMVQIRFQPGHKIADNFYMRQDGTRSYFFSTELMEDLFRKIGFEVITNCYIHRRTINKKENLDVPRVFLQSKVQKPIVV